MPNLLSSSWLELKGAIDFAVFKAEQMRSNPEFSSRELSLSFTALEEAQWRCNEAVLVKYPEGMEVTEEQFAQMLAKGQIKE